MKKAESDVVASKCKACGQWIGWLKTKAGKNMPVDYKQKVTIVTTQGEVVTGYISHFATCPNWRKPDEL